MDYKKRNVISKITKEIRSLLFIDDDDFDIEEVVKALNGSIIYDSSCLDEAYIIKSSNEKFEIHLGNVSNRQRMRFSIAHELGHLFLHMNYLSFDEWSKIEIGTTHARNTNIPYSIYESDANEFAGAFLMPKDRFLEIANDCIDDGYYILSKIAKKFDVSVEAVNVRGKILGLWE